MTIKSIHTGLISLLAGILSFPVYATNYYASPSGKGDGTNVDKPTSFANGLKKLSAPGDTLYLLSGQYDLQTIDIKNLNGTAEQRIVISGLEGVNSEGSYDAILDFRTTAYGKRGIQVANSCSYIHIKNMTLRYSGKNNLINYGSHNLFENLDIYGSADTGCQMKEGGNNIIKHVDSHDNFDYELDKSGNLTQCDFGGNADGFADKQFSANGNHYIGCRAWNNSDDGWDFFQRVSNSQTVMEQCVCYANGPASYNMKDHPRYETDKAWFDQFKNGRTVIDADGNEVYVTLEEYPNMGNGNGFKLGGDNTGHNALVHHCLAVSNTVKGFDQNNDAGTLYLYNNSAYDNGFDYGFGRDNGCRLYIQNCISFRSRGTNGFHPNVVQISTNNTWNSGFSVSADDFVSLDKSLILANRQADGSLPAEVFMALKEGSALVDAGTPIKGITYSGTAPDLGWFEVDKGPAPDPIPDPEEGNTIFYWQMSGTTAPENGSTLTAEGGTIYAGTTDDTKSFGVETAGYVSAVPQHMRATDGYGLKMTSNALYLELELTSGSFYAGDTLYICGNNVWKIGTSLDFKNDLIDSIATGTSISTNNYNYLVLPDYADKLYLARNRGKGTGVSAIVINRKKDSPHADTVVIDERMPRQEARKVLVNGQLFILRGEEKYTIQGQKVK